jgi:dihydrofolate reductase
MSSKLVYFNTASLDGYIADRGGSWEWGYPDTAVHTFVNQLFASSKTQLLGRKTYEIMTYWDEQSPDEMEAAEREFADQWAHTDKIVYSRTLTEVTAKRTEVRGDFDADEVRELKASLDHPISIGGGELASVAARAGLLDEVHLLVAPAIVGGGTRFLADDLRLDLELFDERRFGNGMVYLAYRVR